MKIKKYFNFLSAIHMLLLALNTVSNPICLPFSILSSILYLSHLKHNNILTKNDKKNFASITTASMLGMSLALLVVNPGTLSTTATIIWALASILSYKELKLVKEKENLEIFIKENIEKNKDIILFNNNIIKTHDSINYFEKNNFISYKNALILKEKILNLKPNQDNSILLNKINNAKNNIHLLENCNTLEALKEGKTYLNDFIETLVLQIKEENNIKIETAKNNLKIIRKSL